jgi:hypothetical protein
VGSNSGARLILLVGFLAAWIGYDAWLFSHVVLDPDATRSAAHALVETPAVRHRLADNLTKELEQQVPSAAGDPHVRAAVTAAVRDPRVATAFADTVSSIRAAVLSDVHGPATFTVDGRALTSALHDALAPADPRLAAQIERVPPLEVQLESKHLTHVTDPRTSLDVVAFLATMAALLLITASLLLDHERRSIARVGRRTASLAVTPILVFAVLPRVLSRSSSDAPEIASALLRVYGNRALPSAIALAIVGLAIVAGTVVWPRRPRTPRSAPPAAPPQPPPESWPRSRAAGDASAISEKTYL